MSSETPAETIERLESLNHKLSTQIIGMSDRLNGSILQVAQSAWSEDHETGFWKGRESSGSGEMKNGPIDEPENPYTEMIKNKTGT